MLMKTPPPRYRKISGPAHRRPRWRVFLACLPLSGLLLVLLVCALIGVGTALVWLTTPPESSEITRVRQLQPLLLPTLTPTLLPTTVTGPGASEIDSVEPTLPPPVATSSPTPYTPITPTVTLDENPAFSATAAPIAAGVTPLPVSTGDSTSTPLPTPTSTTTPLPASTPTPSPNPGSDEGLDPMDTATATLPPGWWQDYLKRTPTPEE